MQLYHLWYFFISLLMSFDSDFMFVIPIKRTNDDKIEILVMIKIEY